MKDGTHLITLPLPVIPCPPSCITYVITAPRLGDANEAGAMLLPVVTDVVCVTVPALFALPLLLLPLLLLLLAGGVDSDLGDPFDMVVDEFLLAFVEDELTAVELRTLIEVRLLLALDGGGG